MNACAICGWPVFRECKLIKHIWHQIWTEHNLTFDNLKGLGTHKEGVLGGLLQGFLVARGLHTGHLVSRCAQLRPPCGLSCTLLPFCAGWFWFMTVMECVWGGQCTRVPPPILLQGPRRKHDPPSVSSAGKSAHHAGLPSLLPGPVLAHLHQLRHSWTGDTLRGRAGGRSSVRVWRQGLLFQ